MNKLGYVLSIDPGLNHAGAALWQDGELVQAWLARALTSPQDELPTRWKSVTQAVGRGDVSFLVIEKPQIYRQSPGDPNDLINLAVAVGCLIGEFRDSAAVVYLPRKWKGNIAKDLMIERIKRNLSPAERARVETKPASLAHNVWDAVGIGLYYHKRLK